MNMQTLDLFTVVRWGSHKQRVFCSQLSGIFIAGMGWLVPLLLCAEPPLGRIDPALGQGGGLDAGIFCKSFQPCQSLLIKKQPSPGQSGEQLSAVLG